MLTVSTLSIHPVAGVSKWLHPRERFIRLPEVLYTTGLSAPPCTR